MLKRSIHWLAVGMVALSALLMTVGCAEEHHEVTVTHERHEGEVHERDANQEMVVE